MFVTVQGFRYSEEKKNMVIVHMIKLKECHVCDNCPKAPDAVKNTW